jgi:hypothetical protein
LICESSVKIRSLPEDFQEIFLRQLPHICPSMTVWWNLQSIWRYSGSFCINGLISFIYESLEKSVVYLKIFMIFYASATSHLLIHDSLVKSVVYLKIFRIILHQLPHIRWSMTACWNL